MDPSPSSLDAYVRTHACTDVPTYCIALTHTHMHAGTHEYDWNRKPIVTKISQTHKGLKIQNLKTIIETSKTRISQNQNVHKTLPPNLLQTVKRHVSWLGQIRHAQVGASLIGDHEWSSYWFSNKQHYLSLGAGLVGCTLRFSLQTV